jgi:Fe-S oxidoreductase
VATSPETGVYPPAVVEEFERLAEECRPCYQCGQCTSSCPSGRELYRGPRRIVRLILAGEIEAVMKSDDLWRCTACGACTDNCRMEIDIASILQRLRQLERTHGRLIRCPERSAADIAAKRLRRRPRIDAMQFGAAMAARGHVPRDLRGAAEASVKVARRWLPASRQRPADTARPAPGAGAVALPFYAGCALPQDIALHRLVHEVAAGFGVGLDEAADAGCCGHPSRGAVGSLFDTQSRVHTACPACDASLREAGVETVPLWDALTDQASRRAGVGLSAAAPAFVPYVGCLADRDAALATLAAAAEQAGADIRVAYPTLHNGCCGALGGMYRGATKASARLLEFARDSDAPVVTTCVLCRDNLLSAARELKLDVPVRFWPEFFRAVAHAPEERTDD